MTNRCGLTRLRSIALPTPRETTLRGAPREPRHELRGLACGAVLVVVATVLTGCSLVHPSTRPTPGASRNLNCVLEYRPDPDLPEGPDILFLAAATPYQLEELHMSLPDVIAHGVFALGRHLIEPAHLRGVTCEPPNWPRGYRIPASLKLRHHLLCRREGLARVEIEVETKWGACRREIPAGDATPRCKVWYGFKDGVLERLSPAACPFLPDPPADSRRGTTPGVVWMVVVEGNGVSARQGDWLGFHQTVVSRSMDILSSTHFDDRPRWARLDLGLPRDKVVRAIEGMRVGERRRLFPALKDGGFGVEGVVAEDLFFVEIELVAVE